MQRKLNSDGGAEGKYDGDLEILFDRQVFKYMVQELSRDPSVEEGGKYIGYNLAAGDPFLNRLGLGCVRAVLIVDFLPSGPNALRTSVELMPDGRYQEGLFRRVERLDPRIEHVGSWHSHHCNGLETLSSGDIRGYFKTVNKAAYNLDFFIASLVKHVPQRSNSAHWVDHFLFARGVTEHHLVTDRVRIVEWPTIFGALTGHLPESLGVGPASSPQLTTATTAPIGQEIPAALWSDTQDARSILAADKRWFDKIFGASVTAIRRDSQVTLTGSSRARAVAVTYPRNPGEEQVSVSVRHRDATILRIECDLLHRALAYRAALAALDDSSGPSFGDFGVGHEYL